MSRTNIKLKNNLKNRVDLGGVAREIGESDIFTPDSKNFDFYFNAIGKQLDYKIGNDDVTSRKRRATLEVIDDDIKHVAVTPKIYR